MVPLLDFEMNKGRRFGRYQERRLTTRRYYSSFERKNNEALRDMIDDSKYEELKTLQKGAGTLQKV